VAERQQDSELTTYTETTGHFDASIVLFHDPPRQRKTETRAVALGGEEWTKDVRHMIGGNSFPRVRDGDARESVTPEYFDSDSTDLLYRLDRI
jgi:hypothetical protein